MTLEWVFSWWNLIYLVPFFLALLYLGLYTLSGVTFGDPDADVDLDADVDADFDVGLDGDLPVHMDLEAGEDAGMDANAHGQPAVAMALGWLGVGRVPLSLLLMALCLSWGVAGFILSYLSLVQPGWPKGAGAALISMPGALLVSMLTARGMALLMTRFFPTFETYARRRHELLGLCGEAVFTIDAEQGVVAVRDPNRDLFQVPCRVRDAQQRIEKGQQVKLIAYNGRQKLFYVIPIPSADAQGMASSGSG